MVFEVRNFEIFFSESDFGELISENILINA